MTIQTEHLTALGSRVDGTLTWEQLETFEAPPNVRSVSFTTHELTAFCPVTAQPDLYSLTITYTPEGKCVESKTLKLYLNGFRDKGMFGEAIADVICEDLYCALEPSYIAVTAIQQVRGGLQMTSRAERGGV